MFDKILSTPLQQKELSYENIILKENEELKQRYIIRNVFVLFHQ